MKATKLKIEGKVVWKVWVVKVGDRTFRIDGQNGAEDGSNEWMLQEEIDCPYCGTSLEWISTESSKRDAMIEIARIIELDK